MDTPPCEAPLTGPPPGPRPVGPGEDTGAARPRALTAAAFAAFAAFGSFWGVWGASVPRVQARAGLDDGRLGVALLFVGAGALPAMLLAGRALDRWGLRIAAFLIAALGALGTAVASAATGFTALCAGLALVGACSGAADVAMNAVVGRAEQLARRPVITRAHGAFSTVVVLAGLATGLASAAALPLAVPFAGAGVLCAAAGAFMLRSLPARTAVAPTGHPGGGPAGAAGPGRRAGRAAPLLLVGVLGALAFAGENAHQSWSAVFVHDELRAAPGLAAVAPAVFAATVALTRFGVGSLASVSVPAVLRFGAVGAAGGAAVVAVAPTMAVALAGLVAAGAGSAVLFPTLVGIVSRNVEEAHRGRATSLVTTVAYLGFLLGPVYVGLWADATGLRGAMGAVAALGAALLLLAPALLRLSGLRLSDRQAAGRCRGAEPPCTPAPGPMAADRSSADSTGQALPSRRAAEIDT